MPYDRLYTGNGVTIKEAVREYKKGFESTPGSKIRVIGATKTQIHYEVISIRGKKVNPNNFIQDENYDSPKNRKLAKELMRKKKFGGIFQD